MAAAAGSSPRHRQTSGHVPSFSARHPLVPRLYVMPWRQDMENQRLLHKNAHLAGIPVLPHEEALCLCGRERLCHRHAPSGGSAGHAGLLAPPSSHLSRYNSSVVTLGRLYQPDDPRSSQAPSPPPL